MYTIKHLPEDFIVKEVIKLKLMKQGPYLIYKLAKKNKNTESAVQVIAQKLHIRRKRIGYAGLKDKKAVTSQYISIKGVKKENVEKLVLKDLVLAFQGFSDEPISLGDHEGNAFIIIIRNLNKNQKIPQKKQFINYFGEQRFSKSNIIIGKLILQRKWKLCIGIIKKTDPFFEKNIEEFQQQHPNDTINALRLVPQKIVQLYIHSYQSLLWNNTAKALIKSKTNQKMIPLIGFGTQLNNKKVKEILLEQLEQDNLTQRDFIIREIPNASVEGHERAFKETAQHIKIGKLHPDKYHKGKFKVRISFFLKKGCYATEYIRQILGSV